MKIATVLALSAASGIAATHASQEAITPLIVGGSEVPIGEKTWMVGLRDDFGTISRCGAMLIAPTLVLSAAHCPPFKYVAVGTHYKINGTDGEQIKIASEISHPSYYQTSSGAVGYDYKIIKLATASKYTPVPIIINDPTVAPIAGKYATSIGWGNTREESGGTHDSASNKLLRIDLKVLTTQQCKNLGMSPLDDTMVCAGGVEGQDTCNGDSGGPLFLETSKGDALIGVVSWGKGCARKNSPGVYSKLSKVISWLKTNAPGATFISNPDK